MVVYERTDFEKVDVVVVPSSMTPSRAQGAADLMLESRAERAVLFREDLPQAFHDLEKLGVDFTESYEINRAILLKHGIDENRVGKYFLKRWTAPGGKLRLSESMWTKTR